MTITIDACDIIIIIVPSQIGHRSQLSSRPGVVQFQIGYWPAWEHLQLDLSPSSLIDDLDQILLGMAAMVKV